MNDPRIEVTDPATSAQRLYEIAQTHPELWPWITAHPGAYDGLRAWIATAEAQQATPAASAPAAPAQVAPSLPAPTQAMTYQPTQQFPLDAQPTEVLTGQPTPAALTPSASEATTSAASKGLVGFVRGHKKLVIGVAAGLVVLLVAGGGVGWFLASRLGGASSPTAAVQKLVSAVQNKDPLSLYGSLAPSEIGEIQPALEKLANDDVGGSSSGGRSTQNALAELEKAITITPANMSFNTQQLAQGVDRVTWTGGTITLSGDRAQVADALYSFVEPMVRSELKQYGASTTDIDQQLQQGKQQLSESLELPYVIHSRISTGIHLSAIAVQENGGWYVSPMMTLVDAFYEQEATYQRNVPQLGDTVVPAGSYSSPDAAASAFADALATRDPSALAATMSLPERRLLSIYGPWLQANGWALLGTTRAATVSDAQFQSTISGNTAAVSIVHLTITSHLNDGEVLEQTAITGTCATFTDPDGNTSNGCLNEIPVLDKLGAGDFTLSAVNENGTWLISPIATVGNALDIVVDHYEQYQKTGTLNQLFSNGNSNGD